MSTNGSNERRFGVAQGRRGVASIAAELGSHWGSGDGRVRAMLASSGIGGLALAGATLFGLTHVVGGAWHGNPRAIGFGVALATAGMWSMAGLAVVVRSFLRDEDR